MVKELEKKIQKNALAIEEMSIAIETLHRETEELFSELNVSATQLSHFVENKHHFTEENWQTVVEHKKKLEEKLHLELSNIRNPKKIKKAYDGLHVERHWLFVR